MLNFLVTSVILLAFIFNYMIESVHLSSVFFSDIPLIIDNCFELWNFLNLFLEVLYLFAVLFHLSDLLF